MADVEFLYRNGRYAAALYLGGFVVECLLKAALWRRRFEARMRSLLFRSHDLGELLDASVPLPEALSRETQGLTDGFRVLAGWSVQMDRKAVRCTFAPRPSRNRNAVAQAE